MNRAIRPATLSRRSSAGWALRRAAAYAVLATVVAACAAAAGADVHTDTPAADGGGPTPIAGQPSGDPQAGLPDDVVLDDTRDDEVPPERPAPSPLPAAPTEPADAGQDQDPDQPTDGGPSTDPGTPAAGSGSAQPPDPSSAPTPGPPEAPASGGSLAGKVIALDPGHNGGNADAPDVIARPVDAGGLTKPCNTTGTASADGYRESTFNLELARALEAELVRRGATVRTTRSDDAGVGPCIDDRGRFGGGVGAAALVSIHADGAPASARGFHIIRPAGWAGQDASVISASSSLATRARDALVGAGLTPSTYAGSNGIHPRSDIGTLNLSTVPAILLEAGNMHNEQDLRLLRSSDGQRRIAVALADALAAELG